MRLNLVFLCAKFPTLIYYLPSNMTDYYDDDDDDDEDDSIYLLNIYNLVIVFFFFYFILCIISQLECYVGYITLL